MSSKLTPDIFTIYEFKSIDNAEKKKTTSNDNEYKVYRKRWLILVLFMLFAISNLVQCMEFSVIAHIITEYFQVSYNAVDWTTMIVAVVYVVFSIPGTYLIDKVGIQKTIIIGILGTCLGSWIKVASVHPNRFWLIMLGQGIVSTFQICIYPLLPKLAATWYGYDQISTACGLGCIGSQIGIALSFIIPPLIVHQGAVDVEKRLYILNITYAIFATIMVPLLIIFFSEAPPTPPSIAQQHIINEKFGNNSKSFLQTIKTIIFIKPYMFFLLIYAINMGTLSPLQILSNQIILSYYPEASYDVGVIGLLQTLISLMGSMGASVILDKFKKFKITCWIVYFSYFISIVLYIGTIDQGLSVVYITSIFIDICFGAITTLSIELIVEFTYPETEIICTGLVFNCIQITSLAFTFLCGYIFRTIGFFWAILTILIFLLMVDLLFFFIKFDLRRKAIQDSHNKSEVVCQG